LKGYLPNVQERPNYNCEVAKRGGDEEEDIGAKRYEERPPRCRPGYSAQHKAEMMTLYILVADRKAPLFNRFGLLWLFRQIEV